MDSLLNDKYVRIVIAGLTIAIVGYLHFRIRRWAAKRVAQKLIADIDNLDIRNNYFRAFQKNSRWYRSFFRRQPAGWGRKSAHGLAKVLEDSNLYIQKLNDMYTNPSGDNAYCLEGEPQPLGEQHPVDSQDLRPTDLLKDHTSKNTTMH